MNEILNDELAQLKEQEVDIYVSFSKGKNKSTHAHIICVYADFFPFFFFKKGHQIQRSYWGRKAFSRAGES